MSKKQRRKKRHHFLPQFLLRRFASRRRGKTYWVYQTRREGTAEASTVDVAAEKYFYGPDQAAVEDRLSQLEAVHAGTLTAIDAGAALSSHAHALRELVWSATVRTRALREQWTTTGHRLMAAMASEASTPHAKKAWSREADRKFDSVAEGIIDKLPIAIQSHVRNALSDPATRSALRQHLLKSVEQLDMKKEMESVVSLPDLQQKLLHATGDGQIRALRQLLASSVAPESFMPLHWTVIHGPPNSVILGDCCTVALGTDGSTGSFLGIGKGWEEVYLPIGHQAILVAQRAPTAARLNVDQINELSASRSSDAFYASRSTSTEESLAARIGSFPTLFSTDTLQTLLSDVWRKLGE